MNLIPLKSALLCCDCDCVGDAKHSKCLGCGSTALLSLSRVLGDRKAADLSKVKLAPRLALVRAK